MGGVQANSEEGRREGYRGAAKRAFYFHLYNEYNVSAAFATASLLALLGLVTLAIKTALEWKLQQQLAGGAVSSVILEPATAEVRSQ